MARPISWLPRLPALVRAVNESVRSHYACSDIERLFAVQSRSAQMLMSLMPTVHIGKSLLVEREALAGLLARLDAAEDPAQELTALRVRGKPPAVRRRLRELVQRDVAAGLTSLPPNVQLSPGTLAIRFTTVEELASALWSLARILEDDLDGFAEQYEPATKIDQAAMDIDDQEREDSDWIRNWLARNV